MAAIGALRSIVLAGRLVTTGSGRPPIGSCAQPIRESCTAIRGGASSAHSTETVSMVPSAPRAIR
ncbi:MAG TPA: hypothetical protein DFK09_13165 [Erythrobacter sp.]|nr:hypothetical protein [Erythrobacter sp.]